MLASVRQSNNYLKCENVQLEAMNSQNYFLIINN